MGFGAEEIQPEGEYVESGDGDGEKVDQVKVAGSAFKAARLHLPLPGEVGKAIGKTRGALRGMWMDAVPRVYGGNRDQVGLEIPMSGKGFGGGPGPVGRGREEVARDEKGGKGGDPENVLPKGGVAARPKTLSGKGGKKGDASATCTRIRTIRSRTGDRIDVCNDENRDRSQNDL